MRRTFWLASYPKSGNTWFRMLVANLRQDKPVDINDLPEHSGIASARGLFDNVMLFPSGLLTHEECDRLRPRLYEELARDAEQNDPDDADTRIGDVRFVKTHDAWTYTDRGEPLLGARAGAEGAILIVRDPRDVAPSLANHGNQTVDEAITFMGDADASFCGQRDRQPNQLRQLLPRWSGYNAGWLDQTDIPVHLVRYEDMQANVLDVFRSALVFAGIEVSAKEAAQAARFADFGELKKQETERGFREAPRNSPSGGFFRRGVSGAWHDELTPAQVARIEADHADMMARLGYSLSGQHDERIAS
ncbi:MAG: sulfotransferase domain-containing protein [Sphingomonas bacterium]